MSKFTLALAKHAPSIGILGGAAGLVGTVVLASRATLQAQDVIAEHKKNIEATHKAFKMEDNDYDAEAYKRDQVVLWSKTAVSMLKLYGPAIALGSLSIFAIVKGHGGLQSRLAAAASALQLSQATLNRYREQVAEKLGEVEEQELYLDSQTPGKASKQEIEKAGEVSKVDHSAGNINRVFDKGHTNAWEKDVDSNIYFLRVQESAMNEKLDRRGVIFLNDVYEALGFDRTRYGQLVGWCKDANNPNTHISFGLDVNGSEDRVKALINEDISDTGLILNFNPTGVVQHLLPN